MGRREEQKARRQQAIFEAAMGLFREKGFAATTVDEIAAAADIAKGTFFNYFPTKEAVLMHLNELQSARIQQTVAGIPGFAALGARQQMAALFDALATGIAGQHELIRVAAAYTLIQQPVRAEFDRSVEEGFERALAEIVARGQAAGEVRADVAAGELGAMLRRLYFLTMLDWIERPERDLAPLLRRNLDLLFDGLKGATSG